MLLWYAAQLGFNNVLVGHFGGESCVIGRLFAAFWQTTSSCRGRFIVPAYMEIPTKWKTEMCVWWDEYTYLKMWTCVCDEMKTRVQWNEYVYLIMQGYGHDESAPTPGGVVRGCFVGECGHFTECFVGILWVNVDISRSVGWAFRGWILRYRQIVCSILADHKQL